METNETKDVFIQCLHMHKDAENFQKEQKLYSDQTGRFPYTLSRGYGYIMLMYDYESNVIIVESLKTRQSKELAATFK